MLRFFAFLSTTALFSSLLFSCSDVKPALVNNDSKSLSVMFYNVENLFDTSDDPAINDDEFTPGSEKAWTKERYNQKLVNIGKVIRACDTFMPDIIGLCEIENLQVLKDLVASENFKGTNYSILHADSPDDRGIDVAILYNPSRVKLEVVELIKSTLPSGDRPNTRLVMHAAGEVGGQPLHVYVNHWPSRSGGQMESEPNRLTVANNVKNSVESVLMLDRNAQILLMGDFNDYPNDKSVRDVLMAKNANEGMLTNLMWMMSKNGEGSYSYKGEWGCLDQFMVSKALTDGQGVDVVQNSVKIIKHDWMMYTNDKGVTTPNRTYGGNNYYGGYSDHLPIFLKLQIP